MIWMGVIITASMASPISIQFEAFQGPVTTSWPAPLAVAGAFPPESHSVYLPALLAVPWGCPGMQGHSNDLMAECSLRTVIIIFESSGYNFKSWLKQYLNVNLSPFSACFNWKIYRALPVSDWAKTKACKTGSIPGSTHLAWFSMTVQPYKAEWEKLQGSTTSASVWAHQGTLHASPRTSFAFLVSVPFLCWS